MLFGDASSAARLTGTDMSSEARAPDIPRAAPKRHVVFLISVGRPVRVTQDNGRALKLDETDVLVLLCNMQLQGSTSSVTCRCCECLFDISLFHGFEADVNQPSKGMGMEWVPHIVKSSADRYDVSYTVSPTPP